jgi:hypothetical protein
MIANSGLIGAPNHRIPPSVIVRLYLFVTGHAYTSP